MPESIGLLKIYKKSSSLLGGRRVASRAERVPYNLIYMAHKGLFNGR